MTDEEDSSSFLFTYVAPLIGVTLVAIGIAAAVPGAYAMIQTDLTTCDTPTISVESPERTQERFGDRAPSVVERLAFTDLSSAEQTAFEAALDDAVGEAHVDGDFPNKPTFQNGTIITYEGERYYATVVSENPCFQAAPLQFPLGVFAIAFGTIAILSPVFYRKLVAVERRAG